MNTESILSDVNKYINLYPAHEHIDLQSYKEDLIDIFSHFENTDFIFSSNFDISPGWVPMVVGLHKKLKYISDTYQILQIKSKFAGLRYYAEYKEPSYSIICKYSTYDHAINASIFQDVIRLTESKSYRVCEISGKYGSTRVINGYHITLSDEEFSKKLS